MAAAKLAGILLLAPALASAALTLPDGTKWGLKDAYNGTFKIGTSTLKNSLFLKGNVCLFFLPLSIRVRTFLLQVDLAYFHDWCLPNFCRGRAARHSAQD